MKLNKTREQLKKMFIDCLKEERIPWKRPWYLVSMHNGITNYKYQGTNAFLLAIVAQIKDYQDPRWLTMNQIRQKHYHLEKGSKGVPIEYWLYFNKETGTYMTLSEGKAAIVKDPDIEDALVLLARNYYVYNGSCIKGLPEYTGNHSTTIVGKDLQTALDRLIKGMDIEIRQSTLINQAAYRPSEDCVLIPLSEKFHDESSYASTLLHELGHATGHKKRLNRDLSGEFGSEQYALEELRVEMASAFLSEYFPFILTEEHIQNHKAYIQSWISVLDSDEHALFRTIKEAEKIADYMENIVGLDLYVVNDEQMLDYSSNSSQNLTLEIF